MIADSSLRWITTALFVFAAGYCVYRIIRAAQGFGLKTAMGCRHHFREESRRSASARRFAGRAVIVIPNPDTADEA